MSRIDRTVQRARRHLAADEVVMSAALGFEVDGRRRQLLLLTDRRVVLVGLRGEVPEVLAATDACASFDRVGGILTVAGSGGELVLRGVDQAAAERLERLLARHRSRLATRATRDLHHIRIVSG